MEGVLSPVAAPELELPLHPGAVRRADVGCLLLVAPRSVCVYVCVCVCVYDPEVSECVRVRGWGGGEG